MIFMVSNILLFKVKDIITNPDMAWESIDSENRPAGTVRNTFMFPLLVLVSVSAFAGSFLFINPEMPMVYSVLTGLKCFFLFLISIYLTALALNEITYKLDLGKDFSISFRLVVFAAVPFLLCQIFSRFFESLLFINILSLYGLYIFWAGAEKLLNPPAHRRLPLMIAALISFTAIFVVTSLLLTKLTDMIFFSFFA